MPFLPDDSAELFGFWYYKEKAPPETKERRQLFQIDHAIGRCCKLRLIGSSKQIEDILLSSDWRPDIKDIWISNAKELIQHLKKNVSIPMEIDRMDKPKGIAISINMIIRVREDMNFVLQKLRSGDEGITLNIAHNWNLGEEIQEFLKKTAN